jgi:tetraacyldisaccharide 4'-kinase
VGWLQAHWYRKTIVSLVLLPVSWLYLALVTLRRALYRAGLIRVNRVPAPVIVIGNITVGGTGKTPLVSWLARRLQTLGYKPGIVSRGYGGRASNYPVYVTGRSDPAEVGDEPLLLARHGAWPVMVGPKRALAARKLVDEHHCDVIISDDGLQHYPMARDFEIAVIDGERRFGNGYCLPAGPLRESVARLRTVQARVTNGVPRPGELGMQLRAVCFKSVIRPENQRDLSNFAGQRVHGLAGIGYPERFFRQLHELDIDVVEHAYADHYDYRREDIEFGDAAPVIMTEKDAVKCEAFADQRHWYLAVEADPDPALAEEVLRLLRTKGLRTKD